MFQRSACNKGIPGTGNHLSHVLDTAIQSVDVLIKRITNILKNDITFLIASRHS